MVKVDGLQNASLSKIIPRIGFTTSPIRVVESVRSWMSTTSRIPVQPVIGPHWVVRYEC